MQQSMVSPADASKVTQPSARRDIVVVIFITALAGLLAAHFELNERVFSFTRRFEHLQADEWPITVFVLALCLMWVAWRRYRHAVAALTARALAEARLSEALDANRELARENLRTLEAERKHLARELHDELGQYLNAIKLDAVVDSTGEDAESHAKRSQRMLATVDHIHGVVSDMIRRLRPAGLDELGLSAAIESCVDHWQQRLPDTRFSFSSSGDLDGLSEHANLAVYRLVQEGLTNCYKHSNATRIDLALNRSDDDIVVSLSDNGSALDREPRRAGMGLNGMRERVEMLGGTLVIESAPGQGFTIEARIPAEGRL